MLRHNRGFTLFEMLVVLVIISIMVVLVMARYRTGGDEYAVAQAAQLLAGDIRDAQTRAMSGAQASGYLPKGYGVFINSDGKSYAIVLYEAVDANNCPSGNRIVVKTVNLTTGVAINNVNSSIFFVPPGPTTCISPGNLDSLSFTISKGDWQKQVSVNKFGRVNLP